MTDDEYRTRLEREVLADELKSDDYVISYGQDFGKHYRGAFASTLKQKMVGLAERGRWPERTGCKRPGGSLFQSRVPKKILYPVHTHAAVVF